MNKQIACNTFSGSIGSLANLSIYETIMFIQCMLLSHCIRWILFSHFFLSFQIKFCLLAQNRGVCVCTRFIIFFCCNASLLASLIIIGLRALSCLSFCLFILYFFFFSFLFKSILIFIYLLAVLCAFCRSFRVCALVWFEQINDSRVVCFKKKTTTHNL